MPRLHGYRERMDATVFDAFSPRDMLESPLDSLRREVSIRLFGNRNTGNGMLTNLQQAGCLASDQTYVVMTWYARTNVTDVCQFQGAKPYPKTEASADLIRAWDAWAHATVVHLEVGTRPVMTRPLAELFGPRMFGSACGNPGPEMDDVGVLAERMWKRYLQEEYAGAKGTRDEHRFPDHLTFRDLSSSEQERWRAAASVYPFTRPIVIPVRQNFGVRLYSDNKALTALLKIMPENIAPRPLVWVHLDGLLTRDVA